MKARARVWLYLAAVCLVIAASAFVSLEPLLSGHTEVRQVTRDDAALLDTTRLVDGVHRFQTFLEPHMGTLVSAGPNDVATGALLAQAIPPLSLAVIKDLSQLGSPDVAASLKTADAAFSRAFSGLGVLAAGKLSPQVSAAIAAERAAYANIVAVVTTAQTRLSVVRDRDLRQGMSHLDNGRATVLAVDVLAVLAAFVVAIGLGQRLHRREGHEHAVAERRLYETRLQQALEMSRSESAAYRTLSRALRDAVPRLQVEMLIADSSRAHFHRMLTFGTDEPEDSGCGVGSPLDCPATIRGHTLAFPNSDDLDACPYLHDSSIDACSAACVAVSIGGKTVGVLHATGPVGAAPTDRDVDFLELTARRASERIGMIRAFERSETQASSDPLTGLWNRRSLENRIQDLEREGTPYAVAFGDLDHFKDLNDTFGHEAGDRALRLFSRVLREAIRPNDVAARYGGEEFVVILPECPVETAVGVLERVRERLALGLNGGRVPPFTVSFGVASSTDAHTFDEVVAVADHALLNAKAAGRNRVVLADPPKTIPSEQT